MEETSAWKTHFKFVWPLVRSGKTSTKYCNFHCFCLTSFLKVSCKDKMLKTAFGAKIWNLLADLALYSVFPLAGITRTLVLCRQSPLNLHQFCLTKEYKHVLVGIDWNAICQYFASIWLYLALLFITSIDEREARLDTWILSSKLLRKVDCWFVEAEICQLLSWKQPSWFWNTNTDFKDFVKWGKIWKI